MEKIRHCHLKNVVKNLLPCKEAQMLHINDQFVAKYTTALINNKEILLIPCFLLFANKQKSTEYIVLGTDTKLLDLQLIEKSCINLLMYFSSNVDFRLLVNSWDNYVDHMGQC